MSTRHTNCSTFRPIGEVAAEIVEDLVYRRKVKRLHSLGARILAEYLAELGAERSIMTVIDAKLNRAPFRGDGGERSKTGRENYGNTPDIPAPGRDRQGPSPRAEVGTRDDRPKCGAARACGPGSRALGRHRNRAKRHANFQHPVLGRTRCGHGWR